VPEDLSGQVTELLHQWTQGHEKALRALAPLVYKELRRLAHYHLQSERPDHTLQSTALVHEAYLRLLGGQPPELQNRAHFVAVASRLMRQILVDYARERRASKRDGGCRIAFEYLDALPATAWKTAVIARSGRYRRPRLHEDTINLPGISSQVRQIAVKNIGRDEPTLIITNDITTPGKNLFARYAERMMVENELDAYIGGFHLDALTSGVPLNVDLDTTLTVVAGNLYRLLARKYGATSWTPPSPAVMLL